MDINIDNKFAIAITTLLFTNIIAPIISYKIAQRKAKNDYYDKALQNRYKLVYIPLRTLLLDIHLTGASIGSSLSQRVKWALSSFQELKFKKGLKQLSNNYKSKPLYEVEFGSKFPLDEIKHIVTINSRWADAKLLDSIQSAERSDFETKLYSFNGEDDGLLEIQKFELAEHIWKTYDKLNKRLLPQN